MDKERSETNTRPTVISNDFSKILVHKLRSETDAIMVGTNTVLADNPSLTTRLWFGENPTRVILDRTLRIPRDRQIYDDCVKTIIISEADDLPTNTKNTEYLYAKYDSEFFGNLFLALKNKGFTSIMIEGGSRVLQSIIDVKMWDEAFVEVADMILDAGIRAPKIDGELVEENILKESKRLHFAISTDLKIYKY